MNLPISMDQEEAIFFIPRGKRPAASYESLGQRYYSQWKGLREGRVIPSRASDPCFQSLGLRKASKGLALSKERSLPMNDLIGPKQNKVVLH